MPTSRPPLLQGMRSLIPMVCSPQFKRLPPRTAAEVCSLMWFGSGRRLAVDLPDVRSGRAVDRNPARLHGLRDLAHQFNLQQAVVERGSLDLDIVRQIELPLEMPGRDTAVQELALGLFGLVS